jgi:hypothetical protein
LYRPFLSLVWQRLDNRRSKRRDEKFFRHRD